MKPDAHAWTGGWSTKTGPYCSRCKVTMKDWLRTEPSKRAERFPESCVAAVVSDA